MKKQKKNTYTHTRKLIWLIQMNENGVFSSNSKDCKYCNIKPTFNNVWIKWDKKKTKLKYLSPKRTDIRRKKEHSQKTCLTLFRDTKSDSIGAKVWQRERKRKANNTTPTCSRERKKNGEKERLQPNKQIKRYQSQSKISRRMLANRWYETYTKYQW